MIIYEKPIFIATIAHRNRKLLFGFVDKISLITNSIRLISKKSPLAQNDFKKTGNLFSFIILVTLISTFTISSVSAKPHFSVKPTIAKNPNLSLTADFKAVDLGKKIATVYLTSLASANLQCVNPGGNSPPAKEVDFERVVNQTVNIKPNDGDIKRSLSLGPPTFPSSSEICSNPNWRVDVLSLIYENVALHIERENSNILTFNFGNVTQR